ncbi:hypothetical protein [Nocardia alba]|uniref:Uncharacterized protein n=1 Tax=Nocardia alba TaxID=225051 RepID=A0A4R1FSD6_9NOCA|nr:hypothetical protein [Nocardia alba]TCJ97170.1 hypothetical protein DFR71_3206 [Nocardia alba]
MGTSLGHDFKNLGIDLSRIGLPEHTPVRLDDRGAYEILLYCVQAFYWHHLNEKWQAGREPPPVPPTRQPHVHRVLRAIGILDGAYGHHASRP